MEISNLLRGVFLMSVPCANCDFGNTEPRAKMVHFISYLSNKLSTKILLLEIHQAQGTRTRLFFSEESSKL